MSFSGMILFGAAVMAGMLLKDTAVAVAVQKIVMDHRYDTIDMSALSERITNELTAVEMRRLRRMSGTIGEAVLKAESVDLRMSESRAEFERERMAEYDAAADRLRAELNATGDLTAFMKSCEEMSERICLRLDKAREEIDTRCREELTRTMDTALTQIRSRRAEVQRSLDEIADAEERRARCADMVREMAETCERQTAEMAERFEGTKAQSAVSAVSELLRKARTELDAGLYEAALISVFAADDALCLRVQDMITDEVMLKSLYIRAASETERVAKVYDALREGDLVTDRTASGEHIERHIEDMAYYYRGAYETIGEELKRLRQALETPYTEMTAEELTALYADADRLGEDMLRETVTAYERLHGEHMRKEMAKVLVGKYRAKGYELIPLTDEDRAVSPLDRITVRLENTETLERLELRLNSVTDESGHISMEINIVDHTVYEGSFDEIERQREQKRLEDIAALRETELARDLPMRQRCEDPGVSMKEDI